MKGSSRRVCKTTEKMKDISRQLHLVFLNQQVKVPTDLPDMNDYSLQKLSPIKSFK